jgi:prepilin-type N-terminal cleavage/methylation domain-containing protein
MKTNSRTGRAAFTLIELMAVITIIVILAGLVVAGMGFVTERQAKEKAKVQIGRLAQALEEYKLDNGSYPATPNSAKGENASSILFKALFWDSDNDGSGGTADADQKIYMPDLDPGTAKSPNKQGWTSGTASSSSKITDPWGSEYRYRSAKDATGADNVDTQNPDFDLWSSGKDLNTNPSSISDKTNRDDIKN